MRLAITLSCLLAGLAAGLAYAARGDAVVPGTIAYTSFAAGDIYLLENGKRRRIAVPGNDSSATWSPDGKRLAFSHTHRLAGRRQISTSSTCRAGTRSRC